jgi:Zn-dependent M28 family amino/carboxypeptidase
VQRALRCAALAIAALLVVFVPAAAAAPKVSTKKLRKLVTVRGILEHEQAFQSFANANGGNRSAGSPGYDRSVEYVARRLRAAGYRVRLNAFDFPTWEENNPSQLFQVTPTQKQYAKGTDFLTATFSSSGDVAADIVPTTDIVIPSPADNTSNSGCEPGDFPGETTGNIALIQRGTCPFVQKINNAKAAGAAAVLLFNEGNSATRMDAIEIGAPPNIGIPVLSLSFAAGQELYNADQGGDATSRVVTDATTTPRTQYNVLADTKRGNRNKTIVVGAHLDSVEAGPGINDNGSGTATLIETAEAISKLKQKPRNRIRFAFWGAEEAGLIGSTAYVEGLSSRQRSRIALNLNFDMVGSPNFVRFVYDGNTSDTPPPPNGAPPGSDLIERVFLRYFDRKGLETDPTAFDGRSDYGPFIAVGIPAGGLFTGAEGIKTAEQAAIYGGTAGLAYDPCYHQACDTYPDNLSRTALRQMSDAVAHATWHFARLGNPFETKKKARAAKKRKRSGALRYRAAFANK